MRCIIQSIPKLLYPCKISCRIQIFGQIFIWSRDLAGISKITNKSKLKNVENSLKSALLAYNKNYPREIFFYNIYALLEKFQKKKIFFQWETFRLFSLKVAPIRDINLNFPASWHRMGKIWLKIRIPRKILHRKSFFFFFF